MSDFDLCPQPCMCPSCCEDGTPRDTRADLSLSPEVVKELVEALRGCTEWMEKLRASGDAGFWDWEDDEYTRAVAAMAKLEGGE